MKRYVSEQMLEDLAQSVVDKFLFPALDNLVADSRNTWDDAALAIVKPMIKEAISKIADEA